jgi:thymidylate synthase (FAD)
MEYNVEVKLLAITPDNQELVERAGRLCYATGDKTGSAANWLQARHQTGSRKPDRTCFGYLLHQSQQVLTHELVRHRLPAILQRSQPLCQGE